MREARDPRLYAFHEPRRVIDVAQGPQCERKISGCADASVMTEAKSEIVVPARLEQRECALEMVPCVEVLPGEPMGDPCGAMRNARL